MVVDKSSERLVDLVKAASAGEFKNQVCAQSGKHITTAAADLLRGNASYVETHLTDQQEKQASVRYAGMGRRDTPSGPIPFSFPFCDSASTGLPTEDMPADGGSYGP